ncbi:hypothetical protein MRX96_036778 [Rhipicephalus microplus]
MNGDALRPHVHTAADEDNDDAMLLLAVRWRLQPHTSPSAIVCEALPEQRFPQPGGGRGMPIKLPRPDCWRYPLFGGTEPLVYGCQPAGSLPTSRQCGGGGSAGQYSRYNCRRTRQQEREFRSSDCNGPRATHGCGAPTPSGVIGPFQWFIPSTSVCSIGDCIVRNRTRVSV